VKNRTSHHSNPICQCKQEIQEKIKQIRHRDATDTKVRANKQYYEETKELKLVFLSLSQDDEDML